MKEAIIQSHYMNKKHLYSKEVEAFYNISQWLNYYTHLMHQKHGNYMVRCNLVLS